MITDAAAATALAAFDAAPRGVRLHVRGRWRSCPFVEVARAVPDRGRILDLGCGHGVFALYLALCTSHREVTGVDVDGDKVREGTAAATRAGATNVVLRSVEPGWRVDGRWDAITVVDVLYLLGRDEARAQLGAAAAALAPSGSLLVKEIATRPRWKYELARAQELVATKVARITEGTGVAFLAPDDIAEVMVDAGLTVEQRPLHRGRLRPHHLLIGRR
jgi:cyclopropane fatty-acyl-phospholipid synthase-like methyltransferase